MPTQCHAMVGGGAQAESNTTEHKGNTNGTEQNRTEQNNTLALMDNDVPSARPPFRLHRIWQCSRYVYRTDATSGAATRTAAHKGATTTTFKPRANLKQACVNNRVCARLGNLKAARSTPHAMAWRPVPLAWRTRPCSSPASARHGERVPWASLLPAAGVGDGEHTTAARLTSRSGATRRMTAGASADVEGHVRRALDLLRRDTRCLPSEICSRSMNLSDQAAPPRRCALALILLCVLAFLAVALSTSCQGLGCPTLCATRRGAPEFL